MGDQTDIMNTRLQMQYYLTNWVDGLNPNMALHPERKANDWLVWLNMGCIYYINQ